MVWSISWCANRRLASCWLPLLLTLLCGCPNPESQTHGGSFDYVLADPDRFRTRCMPFQDVVALSIEGHPGPFDVSVSRGHASVRTLDENHAELEFEDVPDGGPLHYSISAQGKTLSGQFVIRREGWCTAGPGAVPLGPLRRGEPAPTVWQRNPSNGRPIAVRALLPPVSADQALWPPGVVEVWELDEHLQTNPRETLQAPDGFRNATPAVLTGLHCSAVVVPTWRPTGDAGPRSTLLWVSILDDDGGVRTRVLDAGAIYSYSLMPQPDSTGPHDAVVLLPASTWNEFGDFLYLAGSILLVRVDSSCEPTLTSYALDGTLGPEMATQVALPLGANPDGGPRVLVSSILREFKAAALIELGDDGVAHDVCHVVVPITPRFMDVTLPVVGRFFPGRRTAVWLSLGVQDMHTHVLTMDLDDCSVGEQDIALTNADSLGTIPAPAVIDLNNDGYDDLMASGAVEDALLSDPLTGSFVAVNTATGLFRFADLGILPLTVLDVDGDGHVDLADYLGAYLWRKR